MCNPKLIIDGEEISYKTLAISPSDLVIIDNVSQSLCYYQTLYDSGNVTIIMKTPQQSIIGYKAGTASSGANNIAIGKQPLNDEWKKHSKVGPP